MRDFGWMRVAFLFFALTALTAIVRMGDSGAEARSLVMGTTGVGEKREAPAFKRWTGDALSSLEDARGEAAGPGAQKIVEPRVPVPAVPTSGTGVPTERGETAVPKTPAGSPPVPSPPVFYRPSAAGDAAVAGDGAGPVCGDLGGFPESSKIVFPLAREYFYSYEDTWGAARPQGGHEGTDLMTPAGVPEYAVTDGTVVTVSGSNPNGWNTLGGYAVMVRADYSIGPVKQGDLFYYAHLERESPLEIGTRVRAGQVIGYSGDTGQGPEATRGLFPPHLHLGWYDGSGGRSAVPSGAMNPYPLLEWIKSNGGAVAGGSDARYCEALGPRPTAEPDWPAQPNPGVGPDLDTGSNNPSPVVRKNAKETAEGGNPKKTPEPPSKPPEKNPKNDREEPPEANRPEAHKPTKPSPPADKPPQPDPPKSPGSGPTPGQYDPATGGPPGVPGTTTDRPPKNERKPGAEKPPENKPEKQSLRGSTAPPS